MTIAHELRACADELGRSIEDFRESCKPGSRGWPEGVDPYRVRDTQGRPILADLLAARGNVLAALARLAS